MPNQDDSYRNTTLKIWHEIIAWGNVHMRRYPWRDNPDGYKILIAEIMLHRTRADQVNMVYPSFIKRFEDFKSIVDAGPDEIRQALSSLGLTWRANLMYSMAKEILEKYNGFIPKDKHKLMELPGVGKYIASAVLCFGYDLPEPVLDTNTVRVIGRIFGIKITDSSRRSKRFESILSDIISHGEPRKFSLSLIDFAALICTAGAKPKHDLCPLRGFCAEYNKDNLS